LAGAGSCVLLSGVVCVCAVRCSCGAGAGAGCVAACMSACVSDTHMGGSVLAFFCFSNNGRNVIHLKSVEAFVPSRFVNKAALMTMTTN